MGVPYPARGVNIISVALDAPADVISALSGKIGRLEGVTAKTVYAPETHWNKESEEELMKQWMKKGLALCLALAMCLSLAACGGTEEETTDETPAEETPAEESVNVRVAALKGPTAMGMVKLMSDSESAEADTAGNTYEFTLAASADEVSPKLMQGELDIACVPANLASVLYNRTEGGIVTLAVNTLGVLYIVENGNAVQSMADLAGKTIVASGKTSTPEYALRYLLSENGIDPDTGLTIDWKSEHSECVAALASGTATVAMLPQPFVTVAQTQLPDLRIALDLTEEWGRPGQRLRHAHRRGWWPGRTSWPSTRRRWSSS